MTFNERFDKLLRDRNISNYRMSKDTHIADSLIGYWRQGVRKPAMDNIITISDYLGVSLAYLIKGEVNDCLDSAQLSKTESEIIDMYRLLDGRDQEDVYDNIYCKYQRTSSKKDFAYSDYLKSDPDEGENTSSGTA